MNKFACWFVVVFTALLSAQETAVNTRQDSVQREPVIARDASLNVAAAWTSWAGADKKTDIAFRYFPAVGSPAAEVTANTLTAGEQEKPAIALSPSGQGILVWASLVDSQYDIRGRLVAAGALQGAEFTVNSTTLAGQNNPAAAVFADGSSVVVWDSWFQDGGDRGVYGQRFTAAGVKAGAEFRINQVTAYSQCRPRVAARQDGRFVVVWESFKQDVSTPSGYGVFYRIFNADGTPYTDERRANTFTADYQWIPDVCAWNDNSFLVAWCSWGQDGEYGGIYAQRFTADGSKAGGEVLLNKTTAQYQWLPRVQPIEQNGKGFIAVWSSWKQDGSREGVYAAVFDSVNRRVTFESRVNEYTSSYQWEPSAVSAGGNSLLAVWASWNQYGNDYDIIMRRFTPDLPQAAIRPASYAHTSGVSSARIVVHVVDSTVLSGHLYEASFDTALSADTAFMTIKDLTVNTVRVNRYKIDRGINVFYLSPLFDGLAVEVIPDFKLALDTDRSYFVNSSGTNIPFTVAPPTAGTRLLAPVDIALIWGRTDTLTGGTWAFPLDTALGLNGQRNILTPFRAVNLMTGAKVSLLVKEPSSARNSRWDLTEDIVFLTPPPYQVTGFNTQAQVSSAAPVGGVILPGRGDTQFVLTKRPLSPSDKYTFTASRQLMVTASEGNTANPFAFTLGQNYPNPFNPVTAIEFTLPSAGTAELLVFDALGRKVAQPFNGYAREGKHRVLFNGGTLASGVYFYTLRFSNLTASGKMLLLK